MPGGVAGVRGGSPRGRRRPSPAHAPGCTSPTSLPRTEAAAALRVIGGEQQAQSALHLAAAAGHVPVCRILLDAAPEVPPSSYPPFSFPLSLELSGRREGAVRSARDVGCGCRVCRVLVYVHVCVCVCGRVWSGRTASGAAPCTMLPMRYAPTV
eukprot:3285140-Rhodomonas_salina.2